MMFDIKNENYYRQQYLDIFCHRKKISVIAKDTYKKDIRIFVCPQLLLEFADVVSRPKIQRYIKKADVNAVKLVIDAYCESVEITHNAKSPIRDPNDLYLLSLAETVNADYIGTFVK